jgi:hypothetical protein
LSAIVTDILLNVNRCEEKRGLTSKLLPKKPARVLRNTLEQIVEKLRQFSKSVAKNSAQDASIDRDFQQKRKEVIFCCIYKPSV